MKRMLNTLLSLEFLEKSINQDPRVWLRPSLKALKGMIPIVVIKGRISRAKICGVTLLHSTRLIL